MNKLITDVEETFSWGREGNYEKGQRFERLSKYLLESLRVAESIHNIPTTSNQIDYLVYIKPHRFYHPFLAWIGLHFLVECKNENSSISSREVADLSILMDDYKCKLGLFISRNDFSGKDSFDDGNSRRYKEYWKNKNDRVILGITFEEIKRLSETKENLLTLIREKHRLFINEKDIQSS